jgi:tetratricopeptide (TPR) repeat protein
MNQQSGGNPLFIREYINLLHARKLVKYQKGHFTLVQPELDVEIPFTIQSVIKQRFSLIGADLVRVLTYASVQGESFNGRILAKLLQIEETKLLDQLNQLDHVHHLIRESSHFGTIQHWGTNFQFIHALVQETIYNTLNMGQRQYLHSKTAELMEGHYQTDINQVAILIATHYERSHTLPKAITYYLMAGQNALAAYALDDALSIANTVLRLIDLIPERVPLNELMTLEDSGYRVDTIQLHHQLINHFNEGELRTLCFELQVNYNLLDGQNLSDKSRELILYFERRGKLISLVEKCKKHRPHIEWQDGGTQNKPISLESYLARWKIEALLQIARVQNWRAEWEAAIGTCDVGQRLCQRENLEEEEAFFLYHRGTAVVGQGNEKKSLEYTQDALRLLGDNPKNTILMCQFYGRLGWLSRYHPLPEVEQVLEKALKFAKLYGASDVEARARRHQAWLEIYRKDNAKEGRKLAQKAYDIAYNHKDIYEQIQNLSTLGQAYRRLGDGEKAIQSNQNAVNLAEQNNLPNLLHTALTGLATSYAHVKDDWLKALATIQRAVLLTEQFQYPPSYTTINVWFHLALGLGQWPEAERAQHLSIKYRPIQKSGGHYLARQGHLAYAQAKYDAARQNYEKAILAFQGTYTDSREVRILQPYYSLALIRVGELDLAKSNLHEAQAYWQTREKSRLARSLQGLALVFAHQGERQKAISELQKAIDLAHNSYSESFLPLLPTIELDLAHLLLESSKLNEAEQYAYSAYMRFELIKHHLLGEAAFLFGKILVSQNTSEKAKRFLSLAKSEWIRLDFYDHLSQWESYIEENKLFFEN